jgi:hypothetical protein
VCIGVVRRASRIGLVLLVADVRVRYPLDCLIPDHTCMGILSRFFSELEALNTREERGVPFFALVASFSVAWETLCLVS